MALLSDSLVCLLWNTWSGDRILKTFMSCNHTMAAAFSTKLLIEVAAICEQKCAGKGLYLSVNQANRNAELLSQIERRKRTGLGMGCTRW
jgi:hypothetical protein